MITPAYCLTMARYNRWQNRSLVGAADGLTEGERREDRGAFFGSIHATLAHILLGDTIWMSRFDGWEMPEISIANSAEFASDWAEYKSARADADERIIDWAGRVQESDLSGDLQWYSGVMQREFTRPVAICVTQLFNHQTHHRGQTHAMLTAAGARPEDTDLPFMPEDA